MNLAPLPPPLPPPPPPPSPCTLHRNNRNAFEILLRQACFSLRNSPPEQSGRLDLIDDDAFALLFEQLYRLRGDDSLYHPRMFGTRSILALARTCNRARRVLEEKCKRIYLELQARRTTCIRPVHPNADFAFTRQVKAELHSKNQLSKLMKLFHTEPLHCAKEECCGERPDEVKSLLPYASICSANADGSVVFAATRARVSPREWEHKVVRFENGEETHSLVINTAHQSEPVSMVACPDGERVAFICTNHNFYGPPSLLHVWQPVRTIRYDGRDLATYTPQAVWWRTGDTDPMLLVLHSAAYVHPSGHLVNQHELSIHDKVTFAVTAHRETPWLYEFEVEGIVQTVSATCDGSEVVLLTRLLHPSGTIPKRAAFLCYEDQAANAIRTTMIDPSAVWRLDNRAEGDPVGGPTAASISPTGDICLLLHKTHSSVVLEIQHRVRQGAFASVQTLDMTTHLSLGLSEANNALDAIGAQVKLSHEIFFSPCGSYAVVLDKRPRYNAMPLKQNVMVVSLSTWHLRNGLRAMPLVPRFDMLTRSLCWTPSGFYLGPTHGLLSVSV